MRSVRYTQKHVNVKVSTVLEEEKQSWISIQVVFLTYLDSTSDEGRSAAPGITDE